MFRHKKQASEDTKKTTEVPAAEEQGVLDKPVLAKVHKDTSPEALRDLLEKNLKWSQIIYEQNRRINSKLFWQTFAGWIRILLIVVPLILAVVFLAPFLNGALQQYQSLLGPSNAASTDDTSNNSSNSIEKFLKLLPLDPAKQEQIKTILK